MPDYGQIDLSKLALPQQASPLPPTAPVAPSGDPFLQSAIQSAELGRQQFSQTEAERRAIGSQIQQKLAEQSQVGPRSYQPQFQPANSFRNVAGDVGRGLMSVMGGSVPGQSIQGAVYGKNREQYGRLAEQIKSLQELQTGTEKPLEAESQLGVKSVMAAGREQQGAAAIMNAQNRAVHDRTMEQLKGQMQQIQKELGAGKLTAEAARTQAMILIGRGHDQAIQAVAGTAADQRDRDAQVKAFEDEFKVNTDNMFKQFFGGLLGTATQPPSANPAAPAGPKASGSKPGANVAAGAIVYDPQGIAHRADGTAPLPKGWSTTKKQ